MRPQNGGKSSLHVLKQEGESGRCLSLCKYMHCFKRSRTMASGFLNPLATAIMSLTNHTAAVDNSCRNLVDPSACPCAIRVPGLPFQSAEHFHPHYTLYSALHTTQRIYFWKVNAFALHCFNGAAHHTILSFLTLLFSFLLLPVPLSFSL